MVSERFKRNDSSRFRRIVPLVGTGARFGADGAGRRNP
jgi:hypothetical protein